MPACMLLEDNFERGMDLEDIRFWTFTQKLQLMMGLEDRTELFQDQAALDWCCDFLKFNKTWLDIRKIFWAVERPCRK